jgi:hypothetical protein
MGKRRSFTVQMPKGKEWLVVLLWIVLLIVIPMILHYCFGFKLSWNGPVE